MEISKQILDNKSMKIINKKEINILMCFDEYYSLGALTAMYSLIKNTDAELFNFYLVTPYIFKRNQIKKLKFQKKEINIEYLDEKKEVFSNFFEFDKMAYAYSKISSIFSLPDKVEKIIFIDTDMVVQKDIYSFYNMKTNKSFIAIKDCDVLQKYAERLPINPIYDNSYFNSGLFIINTKLFKEKYNLSLILEKFKNIRHLLIHHDQDLLNILLSEDKYVLDNYFYNYYFLNPYRKVNNKDEVKQAFVVHFFGSPKPWNKKYTNLFLVHIN